jgi:hypothetical protein
MVKVAERMPQSGGVGVALGYSSTLYSVTRLLGYALLGYCYSVTRLRFTRLRFTRLLGYALLGYSVTRLLVYASLGYSARRAVLDDTRRAHQSRRYATIRKEWQMERCD